MPRSFIALAQCALIALGLVGASTAADAQVVALGASNTVGYPTLLEAMLRAKGYNVTVSNAGVNGDTTSGMLGRVDSAVPPGTRVVILQPGGNDARRGLASSVPQILARLHTKGVKVVMLGKSMFRAIPPQMHQGHDLTAEGYRLLAARLLPQVIAALGSRR